MNTWIGTSGFQYPEWKGDFYPADLSAAKMLAYYAERFPSTESNYTFRQMPAETTIAKWRDGTPDEFRFSCKAPQKVTHFARLKDCGPVMERFHELMLGFGPKRGAVLFQLPPNFQKKTVLLDSFLNELPKNLKAAFEFRHESWFDDEIFDILRNHNAALCIAESADLVTPKVATADFGYLRLRREDYKAAELKDWSTFIRGQRKHWKDAFIYFKHEATCVGPKFAASMQKLLA